MSKKFHLPPDEPKYVRLNEQRPWMGIATDYEVVGITGSGPHKEYKLRNLRTNEHTSVYAAKTNRGPIALQRRDIEERRQAADKIGHK